MPELVCIKRHGVSYCWNYDTKCIETFTREAIDIRECPSDVIYELLKLVSDRAVKDSSTGGKDA